MIKYVGEHCRRPYFPPDCVDNIKHDVPDGESFVVVDRNGVAICGRVCENSKNYHLLEARDWELQ